MKRLNDAKGRILILLSVCLHLIACSNDNDNFPKGYVGFEHSTETVECKGSQSEHELTIKIVATDKSKEDRTVALSIPSWTTKQAVVQLTEKTVTIKAGKKSATTVVKIHPQQMVLDEQNITLSCTPQWEENGISKLIIKVKR